MDMKKIATKVNSFIKLEHGKAEFTDNPECTFGPLLIVLT